MAVRAARVRASRHRSSTDSHAIMVMVIHSDQEIYRILCLCYDKYHENANYDQ